MIRDLLMACAQRFPSPYDYWCYFAVSANGEKVVALPYLSSSNLNRIYTLDMNQREWKQSTLPYSDKWRGVAMSSDGSTIVAIRDDSMHRSRNGGASWTQLDTITSYGYADDVSAIAVSSDGVIMAATAKGGYLHISDDSGDSWTARSPAKIWSSIAMSLDGSVLVATASESTGAYEIPAGVGSIYTSWDSGTTWVQRLPSVLNNNSWDGSAISADGSVMAVTDKYTSQTGERGYLYLSYDSGATWTRCTALPNGGWRSVAMSQDGALIAAAAGTTLYISTDSGATWISQSLGSIMDNIQQIAMSADGQIMVTGETPGYIFISEDYGVTWSS